MQKVGNLFLSIAVATLFLALMAGCSSDSSSGDHSTGKGSLTIFLADAPAQNYLAVYVTIKEVQVHTPDNGEGQGGWQTVGEPRETYDLLKLVNGVVAKLGETELDAGPYSQLRMILADAPDEGENILGNKHPYPNYFVDDSGEKALQVPSGYQTGIKLVSGFTIIEKENTELVLDFDAHRSVVKAGKSGKYLLKPTIKVVDIHDSAIFEGTVTDVSESAIADAIVSAQIYDAGSETVTVFTATRAVDDGGYRMHLPPDDYAIVAYKGYTGPGSTIYGPGCKLIDAGYGGYYAEEDFTLDVVNDPGMLLVDMENIFAGATMEEAVFSIRALKTIQCNGEEVTIEVASLFLQEQDESVDMVLPAGEYKIRVARGETVWEKTVDIKGDDIQDITF